MTKKTRKVEMVVPRSFADLENVPPDDENPVLRSLVSGEPSYCPQCPEGWVSETIRAG